MTKNLLNWLYTLFCATGATTWSAALYLKDGPIPMVMTGLFVTLTAYFLSQSEVPNE